MTLASLVERETAVDGERPLVASVFENRLDKNMPLMTDPSVIYGLELENAVAGHDLRERPEARHAVQHLCARRAPSRPGCEPGMRSRCGRRWSPAQTNYLYFVAAGHNPQGKSLFAATIEEHNRNVAGYRHAMKKAGGR